MLLYESNQRWGGVKLVVWTPSWSLQHVPKCCIPFVPCHLWCLKIFTVAVIAVLCWTTMPYLLQWECLCWFKSFLIRYHVMSQWEWTALPLLLPWHYLCCHCGHARLTGCSQLLYWGFMISEWKCPPGELVFYLCSMSAPLTHTSLYEPLRCLSHAHHGTLVLSGTNAPVALTLLKSTGWTLT